MTTSLLAHLASSFTNQYENVANSSIAYLLNNYPAARQALKKILQHEAIPEFYKVEDSRGKNGRPDVTGVDIEGRTQIIIEGKFWASLTDNQPDNYLHELAEGGKLLFLVPERRISSLRHEIIQRAGSRAALILIMPWNSFIELIDAENAQAINLQLTSDLYQLKELCNKMDTTGMPPLNASDLDPMNARLQIQFVNIIDECNKVLRPWKQIRFKGLKSVGQKHGYGFYFKTNHHGYFLSYNAEHWYAQKNHAPFWLVVYGINKADKWHTSQQIADTLHTFDPIYSTIDSYIGIKPQPGMDQSQIIQHLVNRTKQVVRYLQQTVKDQAEVTKYEN